MVFSSIVFLSLFLPIVLIGYYFLANLNSRTKRLCNAWLLMASLVFYAYGEPTFVLIMIFSIIINYVIALLISKIPDENQSIKKAVLIFDVLANLLILFVFKYLDFVVSNISSIGKTLGFDLNWPLFGIALPIGISFFTFQAMSYVIDVYRGNGKVQKNPINVALYIAFFPQLVAGPIVRYQTVAEEIQVRKETVDDFFRGVERFVIGLSKKVILANHLSLLVDQAHLAVANNRLTLAFSWAGALAYSMQIYFDFSGYSDMAIGLGLMFGFHFNENFDHPYMSHTLSEFWRRWHISLSSWFRDYVYIPLGGSRVKNQYTLFRNLFIVWILTGIWHGAGWTFIVWGMMHFTLIATEKFLRIENRIKSCPIGVHLYRIFILIYISIAWVIFRSERLLFAVWYVQTMFGTKGTVLWDKTTLGMFTEFWPLILIAAICCINWSPFLSGVPAKCKKSLLIAAGVLKSFFLIILGIISFSFLTISSYNPFIYFNF